MNGMEQMSKWMNEQYGKGIKSETQNSDRALKQQQAQTKHLKWKWISAG